MYNGVGLKSSRGSGTSGHVQKNCATAGKREKAVSREDSKNDSRKRQNPEILEHDRKRKVELKCLELSDDMEEQGYSEEDIQTKVSSYRKKLLDESNNKESKEPSKEEAGKQKKSAAMKEAFGIAESCVESSNSDPVRQAKTSEKESKKSDKEDKKGETSDLSLSDLTDTESNDSDSSVDERKKRKRRENDKSPPVDKQKKKNKHESSKDSK